MSNVQETLVAPTASIKHVIETIERSVAKVALVVDDNGRLLGTVTDGDVRRGLLRGVQITEPRLAHHERASRASRTPERRSGGNPRHHAAEHLPANSDRRQRGTRRRVADAGRGAACSATPQPVFLMAGGRGQRLRPLTDDCPKPMLPIAGRPMLQIIIESMVRQGFHRLLHLGELQARDGARAFRRRIAPGARRSNMSRRKRAARSAPPARCRPAVGPTPTHPMIVMNGDILTKVAFGCAARLPHRARQRSGPCACAITCCRCPTAWSNVDDHRMSDIVEKPTHRFLVNAGIYVLEPEAVALVPNGSAYDMPTLFEEIARRGAPPSVFPIREYWLDIGRIDDFNKANDDYVREFRDFDERKATAMIGGATVLALIPARGGSKGVPGKNIRPVGGKPLIAWTIEAAKASRYVDRTCCPVTTRRIIDVAKSFGCDVPFMRPAELATDQADSMSVVRHAHDGAAGTLRLSRAAAAHVADAARGGHRSGDRALRAVRRADLRQRLRARQESVLDVHDGRQGRRAAAAVRRGARFRIAARMRRRCLRSTAPSMSRAPIISPRGGTFLAPGTVGYVMPKERSFDIDTELDLQIVDFLLHQGQH